MPEVLLVVAELSAVAGLGYLWRSILVHALLSAAVGVAATTAGLLLSVVAGAVYHVRLHRALAPRGALPRGWWWAPTRYHSALFAPERGRVLPWFYAGAAGAALALAGCALVAAAMAGGLNDDALWRRIASKGLL